MLEFGLVAMNGFCSAIVGSLILCGVAAAPLNGGREGVPVSVIGSAEALEGRTRARTVRGVSDEVMRTRSPALSNSLVWLSVQVSPFGRLEVVTDSPAWHRRRPL